MNALNTVYALIIPLYNTISGLFFQHFCIPDLTYGCPSV